MLLLTRLLIILLILTCAVNPVLAVTKGGINIADRLDEYESAAQSIGPGGWIYIMACPGDVPKISKLIGNNNTHNIMIRGHYPGEALTPEFADAWAKALTALQTASKIYFMPVNEPNHSAPDRNISAAQVTSYTNRLINKLNEYNLRGSKVKLLSPMIDVYQVSDNGTFYLEQLGGVNYFSQFDGLSLSLYGQNEGGNLVSAPPLKRGDYHDFSSRYGLGKPIYSVESGLVVPGPGAVYGSEANADRLMADFFNQKKSSWDNDALFKMFSVFSYNPDKHTDDGWIYYSQTLNAMNSYVGGDMPEKNTGPAAVDDAFIKEDPKYKICGGEYETLEVNGDVAFTVEAIKKSGPTIFPQSPKGGTIPLQILPGKFSLKTLPAPNIEKMVESWLSAWNNAVQPYSLIKEYRPGTPQKRQITSKVCVTDPQTNQLKEALNEGEVIEEAGSNRTIGSLYALTQEANWKTATLKRENLDYRGPQLKLKKDSYVDCYRNDAGVLVPGENRGAINENSFNNPLELIISILDRLHVFISEIANNGGFKVQAQAAPKHTAQVLNPNSTIITCNLATCTDEEKVYQETETEIGAFENYRPASLNYRNPNGITHGEMSTECETIGSIPNVNCTPKYNLSALLEDAVKFTSCIIAPADWQDDPNNGLEYCKDPNYLDSVSSTSDWAIGNDTSGPASISSGAFADLLQRTAQNVGLPSCVLEGVAMIEGGPKYKEADLKQCLASVNSCSAAGPMQFTTGKGPASDPKCNKCAAGYCPNAWSQWGNGGNPCNYADSLSAAARKLKNDGSLQPVSSGFLNLVSNTNEIAKQQGGIIKAGYNYYGSNKPIQRLGGCSYGEFLYKQCNPAYKCGSTR